MKRIYFLSLIAVLSLTHASQAAQLYFNGFETDVLGWNPTRVDRVASGTNGIPSASGSFHAQWDNSGSGSASTGWGATVIPADGYNFGAGNAVGVPFRQYTTSVDVYLDLGNPAVLTDTRFDYTSAINNSSGTHRRDFAFNGGFYDASDATSPGAGTDRFIFSGSNSTGRANSFPYNPARDPVAISQSGWYTFTHDFRDNGLGVLEVELSLLDSSSNLINSWVLSDLTDVIDVTVGGNRYGWFANNEFPVFAFDNASMNAVPEPATFVLAGLAVLGLVGIARRRK